MDNFVRSPKNSSAGASGQKPACETDESADRRAVNINHYHDDEECKEKYIDRIAECIGMLADTAREVLTHQKEQPGAEQFASVLREAILRIEQLLKSGCFELDSIKNAFATIEEEISAIRQSAFIPVCVIEGIKEDIGCMGKQLEIIRRFCPNVTSGSVIVEDTQATQVVVAVKNTTPTAQTVRVRVLRDDVCPARELADKCLMVSGCCSNAITVCLDEASVYEIEVFGLVPGMTVSSIELDKCKRRIKCSRLTASQFVCLTEKCS